MVKNPPTNAGDIGSIPGSRISPGEGNGNTLHYFCLGNLMDRRASRVSTVTVILFFVCEVNTISHFNNEPPCRPYVDEIVLELNGGYGCNNNVNARNATELST